MRIWAELDLEVPSERAEAIAALLMGLGASGVEQSWRAGEAPPLRQPWDRGAPAATPAFALLRTWWAPDDRARVETEVEGLGFPARWKEVDEASWSQWQQHFRRLVIGPGLAVAPPWAAEEGDLVIEPGLAFGTGEHPTTRLCLEAILSSVGSSVGSAPRRGGRCLDVGTGSGVLALCAARLGYDTLGIDVDPDSIATAQSNATRNGIVARFELGSLERAVGRYDLVVANLYAELLVEHRDAILAHLGGRLAMSGIMADRAPQVREAFATLACVEDRTVDDWTLLVYDRDP
jgi:ribosomal protein L11 methyltransferase